MFEIEENYTPAFLDSIVTCSYLYKCWKLKTDSADSLYEIPIATVKSRALV